jgi:hypothetical protein
MRTALLVLAALATLGLSGCISGTAQTSLPVQTPSVQATPKDIHILETLPLDNGMQKHYSLDLAPGWKSAELTLKIAGSMTPMAHQESKHCLTYATPFGSGDTGDKCPINGQGNIVVSQSGPVRTSENVLVHWDSQKLLSGHYSLDLDADPQISNVVYQVDVDYAN